MLYSRCEKVMKCIICVKFTTTHGCIHIIIKYEFDFNKTVTFLNNGQVHYQTVFT